MGASKGHSFGKLLHEFRLRAGLSQEALAERSGLSPAAVASIERGRRTHPRPFTVAALADALNLKPVLRSELLDAALLGEQPSFGLSRLPRLPHPLLGRHRDQSRLVDLLLSGSQVVTVVGPGGVGKTSLALAAAHDVQHHFRDGATFVPLASLDDPELVPSAISSSLRLMESPRRSAREQLLASLRGRNLLLVLDNFEHLLDAAPLLAELVAECVEMSCLVTSTSGLRVRSEKRLALAPLEPTYAADLFVARALAVNPDFGVQGSERAIMEICRRLDYLPLAIELAAAQVSVLPPAALLPKLDRALEVLVEGARDAPDRQRTLRASIEWSNSLLPESEQVLLARLSVFEGGFSLGSAGAVCGESGQGVLPALAGLVEHSMASTDLRQDGRLLLLESIKAYARERLDDIGQVEELRRRHALHFTAEAETAAPQLQLRDQATWVARMETEQDNMRTALRWSLESDHVEVGLRLVAALCWFWLRHGDFREAQQWIVLALDQARRRRVSPTILARLLGSAGWLQFQRGDFAAAGPNLEEALLLSRGAGAERELALALTGLGGAGAFAGETDPRLAAYLDEGLELWRKLGWPVGEHQALISLGLVAWAQGDASRARALCEASLEVAREIGAPFRLGSSLGVLSLLDLSEGNLSLAETRTREALRHFAAIPDPLMIAVSVGAVASVAIANHQPDRGARLLGAAAALHESSGTEEPLSIQAVSLAARTAAKRALGTELFESAWSAGARLTQEEAVHEALETETPSAPP